VLVPKAAIRIIHYSAGAGSSGGNRKISNRRQQQQGKSNIKHQNGNPLDALRQTTKQKSKVELKVNAGQAESFNFPPQRANRFFN